MKLWQKPAFLAILALLILSVPALNDLSRPGFYTSHDGETHAARIAMYAGALKDGQFPPRFANNFYSGLGSPIFVYIYPLPYLLGALIHFTGAGIADSFKILMALSFIFSGIFAYLWLSYLLKSSKAGFIGALFYMWSPYRFLLIYVRASLSEILAYTFVPLALYFLTRLIIERKFIFFPLSTLAIALILLSQNLVALIAMPAIGGFTLLIAILYKSYKSLILSLIAAVLGFLVSAVTYLPSIFERNYIHFDSTINQTYVNHFVTLGQLIRSPWGYGFDLPGIINDQLSFEIGIPQLLVLALSIILIIYCLIKSFKFLKGKSGFLNKENLPDTLIALFFLFVLLISVMLMIETPVTIKIWQNIKAFSIIDIPWRFLGIVAISCAFLAAYITKLIKPGFFFILLVLLILVANRNHLRINLQRDLSDTYFNTYSGTATQYNEFTPHWRETERVPDFFDPNQKAEIISGSGTLNVINQNSKFLELNAKVDTKVKILIHKFYFPGSTLTINGKKYEAFKDYEISNAGSEDLNTQQDKSGLPRITLPAGNYNIQYSYGETQLRRVADLISATTLAFLFLILFYAYAKK
jgi:hypothetical protein